MLSRLFHQPRLILRHADFGVADEVNIALITGVQALAEDAPVEAGRANPEQFSETIRQRVERFVEVQTQVRDSDRHDGICGAVPKLYRHPALLTSAAVNATPITADAGTSVPR